MLGANGLKWALLSCFEEARTPVDVDAIILKEGEGEIISSRDMSGVRAP